MNKTHSLRRGRDYHSSVRILPFAATLNLIDPSNNIMDDLALHPIHRLQSDLLTGFNGLIGHSSSELGQSCGAAGPNPAHVHPDLALSSASARTLEYGPNQLIYGLCRSAASPHKKADPLSIGFDSHNAVLNVVSCEREAHS